MTIIGLSANATYHPTVPAGSEQGWNPLVRDDQLLYSRVGLAGLKAFAGEMQQGLHGFRALPGSS